MPGIFKKKEIIKKYLYHQLTFTLVGILIVTAIAVPVYRNVKRQYNMNKEIRQLENEIGKIEKSNEEMQNLVKFLESDQYIIEEARKNLNLKKPDEEVVVVKDYETVSFPIVGRSSFDTNHNSRTENIRNPRKWLRYFIGG